ncbi:hypothetical protein [Sphingomonas sp. 1185]|uniref:hypothetical protein n=1 Tax=Sphingomonas sp. 1185 TaxID=3156411 RepID=UPI003395750B
MRRLSKDSRRHVFAPMLWHIARNHRAVFFDSGRHDDAAEALLADIHPLGTIISEEAASNGSPLPPSRIATIRDGTYAGRTNEFAKATPANDRRREAHGDVRDSRATRFDDGIERFATKQAETADMLAWDRSTFSAALFFPRPSQRGEGCADLAFAKAKA